MLNTLTNTNRGGSNKGRRVCVIGAGLGGLTAALAFARHGAEVTVHERAEALTEVGAGIQITPNGARALNALGLGDALARVGLAAQAVEPTDALTGRRIARFDLTRLDDAPYRFYHRPDLIGVLAEACRAAGVGIHLGSAKLPAEVDGDLIVGAEGLRSASRAVMNPSGDAFFTGQVAWRAIVDMPAPPVARIWMAPKKHVVTYPLRDGRLNIVAVQERSTWAEEGWSHEDDPAHLMAAFSDVAPELQRILECVHQVHLWGLFRHPVAETWRDGSLCLLGDAAHPTLPFLAQGANLAIEDAYVLASVCDLEDDISNGLKSYEAMRAPRVTRAIEAANSNARNYHLSGIQRRVAHMGLKTLGLVAPSAFLKRMNWLYEYDVTDL